MHHLYMVVHKKKIIWKMHKTQVKCLCNLKCRFSCLPQQVKLVRQEIGLLRCLNLGEWWTAISKTTPLPAQARGSYMDRVEGPSFPFQLSC